jgi:hypothetical protein
MSLCKSFFPFLCFCIAISVRRSRWAISRPSDVETGKRSVDPLRRGEEVLMIIDNIPTYLIYANLYSEFLSMNHRDLHDINFIIFHTLNLLNSLRVFQETYTHTMAPKGKFMGRNFGSPYYWTIFIYYKVHSFCIELFKVKKFKFWLCNYVL